MGDLTPIQLLIVVNTYLLLAFVLFGLSSSDLICQLQKGTRCAKRHRVIKSIVADRQAIYENEIDGKRVITSDVNDLIKTVKTKMQSTLIHGAT